MHGEIAREAGSYLAGRGVTLLAVRVWESPLAWAGYETEIG
ncbi:MAG TPA: hypothetical protein VNL16_15285 [Chloroflexota bacterium]|nr:hypothetical protein [Chloroflexota bacterium]